MAGSSIARELRRAAEILHGNGFLLELGAPVTAAELADAQRVTGLSFDGQLGELFTTVNGSKRKTCGAVRMDEVTPFDLVTLDAAIRHWSDWLPYGPDEHAQFGVAEPNRDHRIEQRRFINAKWFALAEFNGYSTTVYLDADPGPRGRYGQVIAYQHDPDALYFVADDLVEFLAVSNELLERHASDLLFVDGRPSLFAPQRI